MKTMKKKLSKKKKSSNPIEYTRGRVTIKGNGKGDTVAAAIRADERIRWAWIIITLLAMLLYHSAAPVIASGLASPVIGQIRKWLSG